LLPIASPLADEPCFYYWESVECVRRLALTGLLVFFGSGIQQIVVASFIALASLYLYSQYRPYENDALDTLASVAQLMIFIEVFVALLLRADIMLVEWLAVEWVSGVMIAAHLAFGFYSTPLFPLLLSGVGKIIGRLNPAGDEDAVTKVSDEWDVPDKSNTDLLRPVWKALAPSSTEAEVAAAEKAMEEQATGKANAEQQNQQTKDDEDASVLEDVRPVTDPRPSAPQPPPPPQEVTPEVSWFCCEAQV